MRGEKLPSNLKTMSDFMLERLLLKHRKAALKRWPYTSTSSQTRQIEAEYERRGLKVPR